MQKIRIIDRRDNERGICTATHKFNLWDREGSLVTDYEAPKVEPLVGSEAPDIVFCHINDLLDSRLRVSTKYVENCSERKIPVVLYSGGIGKIQRENNSLYVETDATVAGRGWNFSLENQDYVCVIDRNVFTANDLGIVPALEAYSKNLDLKELFSILLNLDLPLEAKLQLLHPCLTTDGATMLLRNFSTEWQAKPEEEKAASEKARNSIQEFPENLKRFVTQFWNRKLQELNPNLQASKDYNLYKDFPDANPIKIQEWTVEEVVKALAGSPVENKVITFKTCFDENYLAALTALRDALLTD